jgi:F0F1-type ATP synthase membrane subunit b/b'
MTILGAIMYFISGCIILVLGIFAVFLVIGITDPVKLDNIRRFLEKDIDKLQSELDESEKEDKKC